MSWRRNTWGSRKWPMGCGRSSSARSCWDGSMSEIIACTGSTTATGSRGECYLCPRSAMLTMSSVCTAQLPNQRLLRPGASTPQPPPAIFDSLGLRRLGLAPQQKRRPLDGAHALMSGQMRPCTVGPDSPGQCEPGLSDDRPRDPRRCYCPELSPSATRSSSS